MEGDDDFAERFENTKNIMLTLLVSNWLSNPTVVSTYSQKIVFIKPFTQSDRDDVDELYETTGGLQDGSESEGTSKLYEFHQSLKSTLFLARNVLNNELLGIGAIDWSGLIARTGLLTNLLVSKSVRREGIGQVLVQHRESLLKKVKCVEAHSMIRVTNAASRRLFTQQGYSIIFDGSQWSRRPFIEYPEANCNMADECILVVKAL